MRIVRAGVLWTACAAAFNAAGAPAPSIVTDHVQSLVSTSQSNVPVTFGQVFEAGAVPRGQTLTATVDGHPVALQVDPKATNPDGSMRHAVITVSVPSLPGDATLPLVLSTTPAPSASKHQPVSVSQLLGTDYDASVSITLNGTRYTASARGLLQAAAKHQTCKPWDRHCNTWLSGPLASEWVVHGPATAANGSSLPHLEIYFAVRAYAGANPGTVGKVRTDIVVGNTDAFAPQGQPQYTATLTSGSATYTSPALTQYAYTRWHHVLWWNGSRPSVYLKQDTQYIQDTRAISRYMTLTPSKKFLAGLRQSCAPLDHCDQTKHMHMTGAQQAIGPLPRWTSVYVIDPDERAYRWMLANTDALGAYSIHYRDGATGWPLSIQKHPYVTTVDWAHSQREASKDTPKGAKYKRDLLPNCVKSPLGKKCGDSWYRTGNPASWDSAHQPAASYIPYMVTGSWYYMSELAFNASRNELMANPGYRGYSKGLIDRAQSQTRAKAWMLRAMADAAWLLPDHYPLKAEFTADVMNSIKDWNTKYTNNPRANPLHIMASAATYGARKKNGERRAGMAPWMHAFMTWSAGHAADLGFAGAAELRNWLAKLEISAMTGWQADPAHGFCWLEASAYTYVVKVGGNWLPDYNAVYAATFPSLVGLTCNSPPMIAAMSKLEGRKLRAGEMHGYAYSPTGFPANLQIGIAAAADSGLPKAHDAWKIFDSRSVRPEPPKYGYNNYPNFAVIPRSLAD